MRKYFLNKIKIGKKVISSKNNTFIVAEISANHSQSLKKALKLLYAAKKAGADSITIHLREDRRHINDLDAKKICSIKNVLVNLEISTNPEIVEIALKLKPDLIIFLIGVNDWNFQITNIKENFLYSDFEDKI